MLQSGVASAGLVGGDYAEEAKCWDQKGQAQDVLVEFDFRDFCRGQSKQKIEKYSCDQKGEQVLRGAELHLLED